MSTPKTQTRMRSGSFPYPNGYMSPNNNENSEAYEFGNFETTMRMLQNFNVPTNMKPIQSLTMSTMHMFTATFLGNIQTMSRQEELIQQLTERVQKLESAPNPANTAILQQQQVSDTVLAECHARIDQLEHRLHSTEQSLFPVQAEDQNIAGELPGYRSESNINIKVQNEMNDRFSILEEQIGMVSKRMTDMIKRYKKRQQQNDELNKRIELLEESTKENKQKNINKLNTTNESKTFSEENITDFRQELKQTQEKFQETLVNHETELEGVLNNILEDIQLNRDQIHKNTKRWDDLPVNVSQILSQQIESTVGPLSHRVGAIHTSMKKVIANINHMKLFCKKNGMPSLPKKPNTPLQKKSSTRADTPPPQITNTKTHPIVAVDLDRMPHKTPLVRSAKSADRIRSRSLSGIESAVGNDISNQRSLLTNLNKEPVPLRKKVRPVHSHSRGRSFQ